MMRSTCTLEASKKVKEAVRDHDMLILSLKVLVEDLISPAEGVESSRLSLRRPDRAS